MARRPDRGPTTQRSVSLPVHLWDVLADVAELQSEAYVQMGGKTKYTVSDLLEAGARMYLQSLRKDLGTLPKTPEQKRAYVKRLAELNQKDLAEEILGDSDDDI